MAAQARCQADWQHAWAAHDRPSRSMVARPLPDLASISCFQFERASLARAPARATPGESEQVAKEVALGARSRSEESSSALAWRGSAADSAAGRAQPAIKQSQASRHTKTCARACQAACRCGSADAGTQCCAAAGKRRTRESCCAAAHQCQACAVSAPQRRLHVSWRAVSAARRRRLALAAARCVPAVLYHKGMRSTSAKRSHSVLMQACVACPSTAGRSRDRPHWCATSPSACAVSAIVTAPCCSAEQHIRVQRHSTRLPDLVQRSAKLQRRQTPSATPRCSQ